MEAIRIGHLTVVLSYLAMNASKAGGDLALTQTSLLSPSRCNLVGIRIKGISF